MPAAKLRLMATLAALAISAGTAGAQSLDNPRCPMWFNLYDTTVQQFGNNTRGNRQAPAPVMNAARQVRMGNCLTFARALAGLDAIPEAAGAKARTPSGPAIRPIYIHAGIVTSTEDDARARAFFERQGLGVRSVGAAYLGRRIYVGPFATAGQLEAARTLAIQAGFAYPYPAAI